MLVLLELLDPKEKQVQQDQVVSLGLQDLQDLGVKLVPQEPVGLKERRDHKALLDHLELLEPLDPKVKLEILVQLAQVDLLARVDQLDQLDLLVIKVRRDRVEKQGPVVQQVLLAQMVSLVYLHVHYSFFHFTLISVMD